LDEANKKAIIGIGAAIAIGSLATAIAYFTTESQNYVAKVEGTRITTEEYDKLAERIKGSPMGAMQPEDMLKRGVTNQLVDRQLVLNEAAKRGLTMSSEKQQAKLDEIKKPYGNDEQFAKVLEANKMTLSELKARVKDGYMTEELSKDLAKSNPVTDNEVKTYYDKNQQFFKTEEEVRASHILVKEEPKAKELHKRAVAGEDFAKLAKENSIDGSKVAGGDLGLFKRGRMVPEFENAAFALKVGGISPVVKSQFGYHIIKLTERHPAVTKSFDEVKAEAREKLTKDREREAIEKWLKDVRTTAKIEYKDGYGPLPSPSPPPSATPIPAASGTPGTSTKDHAPVPSKAP
jgi:parvulin-like peptidyl-prolyl isomerase